MVGRRALDFHVLDGLREGQDWRSVRCARSGRFRQQLAAQVMVALAARTRDGRIRGQDLEQLFRHAGVALPAGSFDGMFDDQVLDENGDGADGGPLDPANALDRRCFLEVVDGLLISVDGYEGQLLADEDLARLLRCPPHCGGDGGTRGLGNSRLRWPSDTCLQNPGMMDQNVAQLPPRRPPRRRQRCCCTAPLLLKLGWGGSVGRDHRRRWPRWEAGRTRRRPRLLRRPRVLHFRLLR